MKEAEIMIPPLFRCPISLDLFKDPVTLSTGQTYDRSCIEKWLASGNLTCPVTMQRLQDSSMVPNHTLRHLIDQWLHSKGASYRLEYPGTDLSIAAMKQIIESDESTLENKLRVLEKVHSLSQQQPLKNSCLVIKLNFFGALFELVLKNAESLVLVEKSLLFALELMPFSDLAPLNTLQEECKYEKFLFLFEKGSMVIKKSLCLVVEAISSSSDTWPLCEKLGKSVMFLQEVVHLVQNKSEAAEAGVRAVSSLSLVESNLENLVRNGAVQGLIAYVLSVVKRKGSLAAMAMSTIENLLSLESAKEAVLNDPCGVEAIVKMVFRLSDHEGSESAVNSLLIICSDSKSAREQVIVCGVLTQLLFLLQSQCSVRSKTKARLLLKLLGSM